MSLAACGAPDGTPANSDLDIDPGAANVCRTSLDCDAGQRCVDDACVSLCGQAADCPGGGTFECTTGVCIPTVPDCGDCEPEPVCTAGSRWCDGGPWYCSELGVPLPAEDCAPGSLCVEGQCAPTTCTAETSAVCDGDHVIVCDTEGEQVQSIIACAEGFTCEAGQCVPRACEPGQIVCQDSARWSCDADGLSWSLVESCGNWAFCEVDTCISAGPCEVGELRCDGSSVMQCTDEYGRYEAVETCRGLCSDGACEPTACEPDNSWCVGNSAARCGAFGEVVAFQSCGTDARCQEGICLPRICEPGRFRCDESGRQACQADGTGWQYSACPIGQVCMAGDCHPPGTEFLDGSACDSDDQCVGGRCLRGSLFPEGYCTSDACVGDSSCQGGGVCLSTGADPYCAATCVEHADCRSGYTCHVQSGLGYCLAASTPGPFGPDFPFFTDCDTDLLQLDADGNEIRGVTFAPAEGQTGLFFTLHHLGMEPVVPLELSHPDGDMFTLTPNYPIYGANADLLVGTAPIQVPATPDHEHFVHEAAPNTLLFSTPNDSVCAYVIPTSPVGHRIDLNLISVGVDGVSEATLETDESLVALIARIEDLLSLSDFELGTLRFSVASPEVVEAFAILRSLDDVQALVSEGEAPGPGVDAALSVDVFLVQDILEAGAIGVSAAMPGAAGLHGFPGSGLVISAASLFEDPNLTGQVIVHELGHFLGLAHTTEPWGESIDPFDDTASCGLRIRVDPEGCLDDDNLMFPYALSNSVHLSDDQRWVWRMNPLTK